MDYVNYYNEKYESNFELKKLLYFYEYILLNIYVKLDNERVKLEFENASTLHKSFTGDSLCENKDEKNVENFDIIMKYTLYLFNNYIDSKIKKNEFQSQKNEKKIHWTISRKRRLSIEKFHVDHYNIFENGKFIRSIHCDNMKILNEVMNDNELNFDFLYFYYDKITMFEDYIKICLHISIKILWDDCYSDSFVVRSNINYGNCRKMECDIFNTLIMESYDVFNIDMSILENFINCIKFT